MSMKFTTKKIYLIIWRDAYHPEACSWWGFDDLKEFIEDDGYIVQNVGYIVHENKDFITIASMVGDHGKSVSHIERIPKGFIIKKQLLR